MIHHARKLFKRILASVLLFTTETIIAFILVVGALALFFFMVKTVFVDKAHALDNAAFAWMGTFVSPRNNDVMLSLSFIGNYQFLITANLLLMVYYIWVKKHRWYSIKIPAIALSSVMLMFGLKALFDRPRPLIPLLHPALGFSFPSGHAMSSVTFYGLLIYICYTELKHLPGKIIGITFFILLIAGIGLSRIYLRVHYASDVIAGYCTGTLWLIISLFLLNRLEQYSKRNLPEVNGE